MTQTRNEETVQKNLAALPRTYTTTTVSARKRKRAVKEGNLKILLPGRYVMTSALPSEKDDFHVRVAAFRALKLSAGLTKIQPEEVVSHHSAGILWDLPAMGADIRVHVIRPLLGRARRSSFALHRQHIDPNQILEVDGLLVTSLEQTALDLAVCLPKHQGLAIIDSARRKGASKQDLLDLARKRVGNGRVKVQQLIELSVDNAESPYESVIRYWLHQAGVSKVVTQLRIMTDLGEFRVDNAIPEIRLIIEFDGKEKYREQHDVKREKRRQDALRAVGWEVRHYMYEELSNPERLIAHFRRLLHQLGYQFEKVSAA
jgi:very-short-patch-repair endonuclease